MAEGRVRGLPAGRSRQSLGQCPVVLGERSGLHLFSLITLVLGYAWMGKLFDQIKQAVRQDRFLVGWHADERCEERGVTDWQIVCVLQDGELVRERPRSKPNPSVVVRQFLSDGSEVEVIWSWLAGNGGSETSHCLPARIGRSRNP